MSTLDYSILKKNAKMVVVTVQNNSLYIYTGFSREIVGKRPLSILRLISRVLEAAALRAAQRRISCRCAASFYDVGRSERATGAILPTPKSRQLSRFFSACEKNADDYAGGAAGRGLAALCGCFSGLVSCSVTLGKRAHAGDDECVGDGGAHPKPSEAPTHFGPPRAVRACRNLVKHQRILGIP